jgi:protein-ribulosamine 3-kinase
LIHGDLWSGNFLCDESGGPVLIDPAVAYGHREMDLAMSRLFGGFDAKFYQAYDEDWPLELGFMERIEIYQLYYLLVHVNLFGRSYVPAVRGILQQF